MPHLIVESSSGLENDVNFESLLKRLHLSLERCPGIELDRVKSRLHLYSNVLVGKKTHDKMIHVSLAVLSGRNDETKKVYSKTLFEILIESIPENLRSDISLTVEVRDLHRESYLRN